MMVGVKQLWYLDSIGYSWTNDIQHYLKMSVFIAYSKLYPWPLLTLMKEVSINQYKNMHAIDFKNLLKEHMSDNI